LLQRTHQITATPEQASAPRPAARRPTAGQIGNQARLRLLQPKAASADRRIDPTDDPLERQADYDANRLMRTTDPGVTFSRAPLQISRKCATCEKREKEEEKRPGSSAAPELQRKCADCDEELLHVQTDANSAPTVQARADLDQSGAPRPQHKSSLEPSTDRGSGRHDGLLLQRRAALTQPDDRLEREADRAADAAVLDLSSPAPTQPSPPNGSEQVGSSQRGGGAEMQGLALATGRPVLLRASDPDETEADAAAAVALDGPALEAGDDADEHAAEYEDTSLQMKRDADAEESLPDGSLDNLHQRIDEARRDGIPIESQIRARLESAFRADFSSVRVHTGNRAAALAGSVRALAFASGRDIFFAEGQYSPGSTRGQHLLAHELAHVLQQGAAPAASSALLMQADVGAVQRKPNPDDELVAEIDFYDKSGAFAQWPVNVLSPVKPGLYFVKLKPESPEHYSVIIEGKHLLLTTVDPKQFAEDLAKAPIVTLVVATKAILEQSRDQPESKAKPPSGIAGPETPPSDTPAPKDRPPTAITGDPTTGDKPPEHPPSETETQEQPDVEAGGEKGTEKSHGAFGDAGSGPGLGSKTGGGSKYGLLSLVHFPPWFSHIIDGVIDTLGDSEELLALRDTLQALIDLADHRDELANLLTDPTTLLEAVLGLKDNAAIDAIERWVASDKGTKHPKPTKSSSKGIVGVANDVLAIIHKVRALLKPVFAVRRGVKDVLGAIGVLLDAVSVLDDLIELTKDPQKFGTLELQALVDQFATEFSAQFRLRLENAPKLLKQGFVELTEAELISYEKIARVVTEAILSAVPVQYKPLVAGARKLGLDTDIADNLVVHLIPKAAYDKVNDLLHAIIKLAKPAVDGAVDDISKIIDHLPSAFIDELPAGVLSVLKPSRKPGGRPRGAAPAAIARLIGASQGEPMDEEVSADAETRLGHSFDDVRVHRDPAAAEASERLNAHAFAIGRDVYFGQGEFAPHSHEGRRLLYHELAHTAQQAYRGHLALQRDYKALLRRLAKTVSAAVLAQLKGATAKSPAQQALVKEITNDVSKLVNSKRKVVSRNDPPLPKGYSYIPQKGRRIRSIRRWWSLARYIPALYIDKDKRIGLTATRPKFDPNKAARAALRAALGCDSKTKEEQAHHIIPLELFTHRVAALAIENGFAFNGAANGICLLPDTHHGSHGKYTAKVTQVLDNLRTLRPNLTWDAQFESAFYGEIANIRKKLVLLNRRHQSIENFQ
jgi:osmotically-inducible protein OsmY